MTTCAAAVSINEIVPLQTAGIDFIESRKSLIGMSLMVGAVGIALLIASYAP